MKPISIYKKRRLTISTIAYWSLLTYILAALIYWFIALQTQNHQMADYKLQALKHDDPSYIAATDAIRNKEDRKTTQYIGEGIAFLFVISVGALFLYRAVMRQIRIQEQQQNFMMAITHELKTPISIARLNLETLQKHKLDEERQNKMLRSSLQEINRLNALTGNILVSAQLEGGYYHSQKDELDFSSLLTETLVALMQSFPLRKWETAIVPDIIVSGDALLLQILINNLVENAVKYAPPETVIKVSLTAPASKAILQVIDQGPGIPRNEKKRIFNKFYRIGNEETRTAQGTGLGLYLCRKIAEDHKALISVSDNLPTGSIFTVAFNKVPL